MYPNTNHFICSSLLVRINFAKQIKRRLHGCLILCKGDKPYTMKDLYSKLSTLWKGAAPWRMVSLGRTFYEFQFSSYEDLRLAWAAGTTNLKPRILRLLQWTKDFTPST